MSVDVSTTEMTKLQDRLKPMCERLAEHRLYPAFQRIEDLHVFMENHVFPVWDFMSLLKTLQRGLTCVEIPWTPTKHAGSRRLVNEIVLGEESDVYQGVAVSHFELYLRAMREAGASTRAMDDVIFQIGQGEDVANVLERVSVPEAARRFVRSTFAIIEGGKLHEIAAAFTFGREDLIPDMFRGFLRDQDEQLSGRLGTFRWYLDRHIEVDGEEHGPMALQMVSDLCGADPAKWNEAEEAAVEALGARLAFWDGIADSIESGRTELEAYLPQATFWKAPVI